MAKHEFKIPSEQAAYIAQELARHLSMRMGLSLQQSGNEAYEEDFTLSVTDAQNSIQGFIDKKLHASPITKAEDVAA